MTKEEIVRKINYLYEKKKHFNIFLIQLENNPQHCSILLNKGIEKLYFDSNNKNLIQVLSSYCTNEIKKIENEISKYEIVVKVI